MTMEFLKRIFGARQSAETIPPDVLKQISASLDPSRLQDLFQRDASFSFIAIPGDASREIPEFLTRCKYTVLGIGEFRGAFTELYARVAHFDPEKRNTVYKAHYLASGYTILLDAEMVLNAETEYLSELSRKSYGPVLAAIWERASETAVLIEIGPGGVVRQSWYCQRKPTEEQKDGHAQLAESPDSAGLRQALVAYGLAEDAVFGEVQATVLKLEE
jgi:hypothetical protein